MTTGDRVEPTKRRAIPDKTRLAVFDRAGGRCEMCAYKLQPGYEIDHIVSLWMGGADDQSNMRALCPPCHRGIKTPSDVKAQAKVRRIHQREDGARRERKKIPTRKFQTDWKRKFNGEVVKK